MERNILSHCASPYLLQHANNPVHWQPWSEEALKLAKDANKPILLSIGYSACHWCHVMAHESFEDEDTARIMNEHFVNIKVDKEERPDLDKIYQQCHQILNQQSGGWPLTVFLDPNTQLPFFSGTYFPAKARHGLPAFQTILNTIANLYETQYSAIKSQNQSLQVSLEKLANPLQPTEGLFSDEPIELALDQLEEEFDAVNGGFGPAPKFPIPTNLLRLLRRFNGSPRDKAAAVMLQKTLDAMATGGLYDQIGGGFFRYSVDERFEIPHFEKMLYDNGALLGLYAQANVLLKNAYYQEVAKETAQWALKKMQAPKGGFYTSLDADSLGIEGKFYTWNPQEIAALLDEEEYKCVELIYNLKQGANFEGQWHLHQVIPIASLGSKDKQRLDNAKRKLLLARKERIAPHKDEKMLTSWNGIMLRGLALAGFLLDEPAYLQASEKAALFIKHNMHSEKGLYACYKSDHAYNLAYLDDYAFLLDGILFSLQAQFNSELFEFALMLADECIEKFYDEENGGFFFTAHSHEHLIQRPKYYFDEALPAGNGVIAFALNRLGHLTANIDYLNAAEKTLQAAWRHIEAMPLVHNSLLSALEEILRPPEIVIVIYQEGEDVSLWKKALVDKYNTHRLSLFIPESAALKHKAFFHYRLSDDIKIAAFKCKDQSCSEAIYKASEI